MATLKHPLAGKGRLTSGYGWRTLAGRKEWHPGVDFGAERGTPVVAALDGKVVRANGTDDPNGYGNQIVVEHNLNGRFLYTHYGHLNRIAVKVGQLVKAGEQIGEVGNTGRSTGPHLHFELRTSMYVVKDGRLDPTPHLELGGSHVAKALMWLLLVCAGFGLVSCRTVKYLPGPSIERRDTVIVTETVRHDSLVKVTDRDTVTLTKNRWQTRIVRVRDTDTLYVEGTCLPETLRVPVETIVYPPPEQGGGIDVPFWAFLAAIAAIGGLFFGLYLTRK